MPLRAWLEQAGLDRKALLQLEVSYATRARGVIQMCQEVLMHMSRHVLMYFKSVSPPATLRPRLHYRLLTLCRGAY